MQRTTIIADEEVLERLRRLAADRRVSLATIIREALDEKAKTYRPKPRILGMGDSGRSDISRRIGEEHFEPEPWR